MKKIKFYDTSSLLIENNFKDNFIISSITLKELENIKTSIHKDNEIKYRARKLLKFLIENIDKYIVIPHSTQYESVITELGLEINNDTKILSDAIYMNNRIYVDEIEFVTNDFSLACIANIFFGKDSIFYIVPKEDEYTGYLEVNINDKAIPEIYSNSTNPYDLLEGEYLVIKDEENKVVDVMVKTEEGYRHLNYNNFSSDWFGEVTPYHNDIYQKLLFDSLCNNKMTIIRGRAGSGKSYCAMAYLVYALERGIIDKIIILCNPVATRDSARLGFYPGDKNSKLLDSQIGNFLVGKFGGIEAVERLMEEGSLVLIPASDCRGLDIGSKAGVYITEAQNTTIDLMQLMLQRIGEDCICIVEGDDKAQVDLSIYENGNNGLRRISEVFRGEPYYGEVTLQNCYRSKIAAKAELM